MADLIDRNAVISCLDSNAFDSYENAVMTLHKIMDIPTIESEPVRRGRWERHSFEHIRCLENFGYRILSTARCSVCRRWAEHVDDIEKIVTYDYCPNCGARMDGGADNG